MLRLGLSIGKVGRRTQRKKTHECFTHRTPLRTEDEGIAVTFDLSRISMRSNCNSFGIRTACELPLLKIRVVGMKVPSSLYIQVYTL